MPTTPENPPATAHIDDLLPAYHAGALAPAKAEHVRLHLSACAACQRESQRVALDQLIRSAPAPMVGPELRHRVYARIAAASEQERSQGQRADEPLRARRGAWASQSPLGAPHHRPGGLWAGAAALVIVALLASVFWALPRVRQHTAPQGGDSHHKSVLSTVPAACPASATSATIPANASIADMALTSPTEGWAVGGIENSQGVDTQGLILRFHQCHWAPVNIALPNISLLAISMDAPGEGWAAGNNVVSNTLVLMRYSGGEWSVVAPASAPKTAGAGTSLLAMSAPTNGWLVTMGPGFVQSPPQVSVLAQTLFHYSQGTWNQLSCPLPMIDAIEPVGPDDVWVAGSTFVGAGKTTTHSFAHYLDGAWTVVAQPSGLWATHLSAISATDIWASGMTVQGYPVVAHYDGAAWRDTPQAAPPGASESAAIVTALGDGAGWAFFLRAGTASPSPMSQQIVAQVWREGADQWQPLQWGFTDLNWLNGWTPLSDGEIWAIGIYWVNGASTPLPGGGASESRVMQSVLLHYTDGAWTRYS